MAEGFDDVPSSPPPLPPSLPPTPPVPPVSTRPPVRATPPPPPQGRGNKRLIVGGLIGFLVIATGGGYAITRMLGTLRDLRVERSSLQQEGATTQQRVKELEQQQAELMRQQQQVIADRDNLLAQNKRVMEERVQYAASAKLHEGVLKRVVEDRQNLKSDIDGLQQELNELQEMSDEWLRERNELQAELVQAKDNSDAGRLKEQLAKEKDKQRQQLTVLKESRQRIKDLETSHAKLNTQLPKLYSRLETLQEQYAKLLSQNKLMQHRTAKMPEDVTEIAREHEQLLQDVADTHYNMGVMFSERNDYTRAVKEFTKVVELKPNDAEAHYNLGIIYAEHLPDPEKSVKYFRKYLQINPDASDASWVKQYIASRHALAAEERLE